MVFFNITRCGLLATFLYALLIGAQDINTQFAVASGIGPVLRDGTNGGSCSTRSKTSDLGAMWLETIDMAQETITRLQSYGSDQVVRATLDTFFGIRQDPGSNSVLAADQNLFNFVLDFFQKVIAFSTTSAENNQPSLFCDDSWRWLTDRVYELRTGRNLHMTISQQTLGLVTQSLWSPRFKQYSGARSQGCLGRTLAYTVPEPLKSITLCPFMFDPANKPSLPSLSAIRAKGLTPMEPLRTFFSQPSTMLHELCHLLRPHSFEDKACIDDVIPVKGVNTVVYGPRLSVELARISSTRAVNNADNYQWFAVAMYLSQWDWSRVVGGVTPVIPRCCEEEHGLRGRRRWTASPHNEGAEHDEF